MAPVALACLWFGGPYWIALVAIGTLGMAFEWTRMCQYRPLWLGLLLFVVAIGWAAGSREVGFDAKPGLEICVGALVVWLVSRRINLALGALYIGIGAIALLWLRADPAAGRANMLFVLLIVWASDIGAYLAGRLIGGPKLAPAISPGKTWSGAAGGLVVAVAVGWFAASQLSGSAGVSAVLLAAGLSVVSQAGDLLESWIKRIFGVKDSSHLIPGHGGLLDRLDGVLAAAPAAAALALVLGRGAMLWQ